MKIFLIKKKSKNRYLRWPLFVRRREALQHWHPPPPSNKRLFLYFRPVARRGSAPDRDAKWAARCLDTSPRLPTLWHFLEDLFLSALPPYPFPNAPSPLDAPLRLAPNEEFSWLAFIRAAYGGKSNFPLKYWSKIRLFWRTGNILN